MPTDYSGASQEAIEFHYDEPADFFGLWLGQSMTYTAARFSKPGMSLDEAQADKITHHLNAAGVTEGARVLDVGCGWGTGVRREVWRFGAGVRARFGASEARCSGVSCAVHSRHSTLDSEIRHAERSRSPGGISRPHFSP